MNEILRFLISIPHVHKSYWDIHHLDHKQLELRQWMGGPTSGYRWPLVTVDE